MPNSNNVFPIKQWGIVITADKQEVEKMEKRMATRIYELGKHKESLPMYGKPKKDSRGKGKQLCQTLTLNKN